MRFVHLGDLHIGKSLSDFSLIEDQRYILNQIIEIAKNNAVDGVLVAGDVYDKAIPSEEAVKLFDYFISQLALKKIKVFIISGNHDSDERLNFGSSLFEANEIYIASKFEGKLYGKQFEDENGKVNVYLLPFVKASQVRHYFEEEKIENYDDAVRVIIESANINKAERNILVAHQFVAGKGKDPELSGSEGIATQNVGLVEKVSTECFDVFDYVALGHIHSPQRAGRDEVRYSGSPLKYSLSEVYSDKSVPIVTLGAKGEVDIELVRLTPLRDVRHIKGKLKNLLEKENIKSPEDFIYITLTDDDIINDAMGVFQQYYPNTVKIDYDNAHTRELEQVDISKIAENKSFDELISEFYQQVYGCEISKEEMDIMKKVAREAGVVDETN